MKQCVKCQAELSDSADNCIFCGSLQGPPRAPNQSTMMGHPGMAQELLEKAKAAAASPSPKPFVSQPPPRPQRSSTQPPPKIQSAPQPFGGAPFGIQNAQFGPSSAPGYPAAPAGYPVAPAQNSYGHVYQDGLTEQVRPLPQPGPGGPSNWDDSLSTQMLFLGVLLIACVVAPWSIGGGSTRFSWTIFTMESPPLRSIIQPIFLLSTGIIAAILGARQAASPLTFQRATNRAFAAVGLGLCPLLFLVASQKPFVWQMAAGTLGTLFVVVGLIICHRTLSQTGRLLTSVGAVILLTLYLVPTQGAIPLIGMFEAIGNAPGKAKVSAIATLLPLLFTLLALLVWVPSLIRGISSPLAWAFIVWGLVASLVNLFVGGNIVDSLKASMDGIIYWPLAKTAWIALAGFGGAGVISRQLSH